MKKYFKIYELVDQEVYKKYVEKAWRFFDPRLLETMLIIREALDRAITINNWMWGGKFTQRGLRHNKSPLVKKKDGIYLSAHMRGAAVDFDVEGMTAEEVRKWIFENEQLLPNKIRLERNYQGKPISWVHLDVDHEDTNPHIYLFDV